MSTATPITGFPSAVLVVDDDPMTLELLGLALEERALAFRTAPDGEAAIGLLREEGFACLLVDKNLPGADGLEVIQVARELQPYCACMVMTAYPSRDTVVAAMRLGAVDYLDKPFGDISLVVEQVEKAIQHQQGLYELQLVRSRLQSIREELDAAQTRLEHLEDCMQTVHRLGTNLIEKSVSFARTARTKELAGANGTKQETDEVIQAAQDLKAQFEIFRYTNALETQEGE